MALGMRLRVLGICLLPLLLLLLLLLASARASPVLQSSAFSTREDERVTLTLSASVQPPTAPLYIASLPDSELEGTLHQYSDASGQQGSIQS